MKFSVIVPLYNEELNLNNTFDTLLQLGKNYNLELILVNDGSTDNSLSIAKNFCQDNKWAKLFDCPHLGVSSARNYGMAKATGDYILFLDADDSYTNDVFKILTEKINELSTDIIVFGAKIINHREDFLLSDIQPNDTLYLQNNCNILFDEIGTRPYVWNCAYNRKFLINSGIEFDTEISLGEDHLFQFCIFHKANTIRFISNKLYIHNYLLNTSTMLSYLTNRLLRVTKHLLLIDKILEEVIKWDNFVLIKNKLLMWIYDFIYMDMQHINAKSSKKLCKEINKLYKKHKIRQLAKTLPFNDRVKLLCLKNPFFIKLYKLKGQL